MIYIGHAKRHMNKVPGALHVYCGRTFAGFKNLGLGNKTKVQDPAWRLKYWKQLLDNYENNPKVNTLLNRIAMRIAEGDDVVLLCWCYEDLIEFRDFKWPRVRCHCEIIAKFIMNMMTYKP